MRRASRAIGLGLVATVVLVGPFGAARANHAAPPTGPLRCVDVASTAARSGATGGSAVGDAIAENREIATGFTSRAVATTRSVMAITAHPLASQVACEVLARGGDAMDAAVAAQMVLNLVEPQSSGLGGGAFLLYYDARRRTVDAYDGRETAPAAALANDLRWIDDADRTPPKPDPRASGRSIGVPGTLAMLAMAHRDHGRLPWPRLFEPAIAIATDGFRIGPRMHASIEHDRIGLSRDADAAAYFLDADGHAKAAGALLANPALARTFATIAHDGPSAFYSGDIARDIVAKVADRGVRETSTRADGNDATSITPGRMTLDDLAAYRAKRRPPVCAPYRRHVVCGMGPPSSGGIAVAATLGILSNVDLASSRPDPVDRDGGHPDPLAVHLIAEAERLAYADRDRYVADPDFVPLPGGSARMLLDPAYLASRARLIDPARSMGRAPPGDFGTPPPGLGSTTEHGTSHVIVADRDGNVVTMTTTVEAGFGSFHFVRGFVLNNELTDFAATPVDADGAPVANRLAGRKRPRSTMAPTLVFRRRADGRRGELELATGSAGGALIVDYVVKTLVGALDWALDAQQAVSLIDFGAMNTPTTLVGGEHPDVDAADGGAHDPLVTTLRAMGHRVSVVPQSSGTMMLRRVVVGGRGAWAGGADPRREGVAVGDPVGRWTAERATAPSPRGVADRPACGRSTGDANGGC